jgi:hypothetical protein
MKGNKDFEESVLERGSQAKQLKRRTRAHLHWAVQKLYSIHFSEVMEPYSI